MSHTHTVDLSVPPVVPESTPAEPSASKEGRRKDKVRSAWIGFFGRIVAHLIGAVATVVLGVTVVHHYTQHTDEPAVAAPASATSPSPVRARRANTPALVVLPVQDYSPPDRKERWADALTEGLTARLAGTSGVAVLSRTSAMAYRDARQTLPSIARTLGADFVIEGSIQHVGSTMRVTAQLIDAASDEHVWAGVFDEDASDPLAAQQLIVEAVASAVREYLPLTEERDAP